MLTIPLYSGAHFAAMDPGQKLVAVSPHVQSAALAQYPPQLVVFAPN